MKALPKLRPLFVAQILYENTDEEHLMTIAEILQILHDKHGIDSYRATIKTDIEMLMEAGLDIEFVKSSQNQYHIVSRDFDIAELEDPYRCSGISQVYFQRQEPETRRENQQTGRSLCF